MTTPEKIKQLESLRAEVLQLEQSIAAVRQKELAGLPAKFGFEDVAAFLSAVRAATGTRPGRKAGAAGKKRGGSGRRGRRAKITDETRAQVKKMVGEGKTGAEIAKATGISLPSVQNIKKALGLVKGRKK